MIVLVLGGTILGRISAITVWLMLLPAGLEAIKGRASTRDKIGQSLSTTSFIHQCSEGEPRKCPPRCRHISQYSINKTTADGEARIPII